MKRRHRRRRGAWYWRRVPHDKWGSVQERRWFPNPRHADHWLRAGLPDEPKPPVCACVLCREKRWGGPPPHEHLMRVRLEAIDRLLAEGGGG